MSVLSHSLPWSAIAYGGIGDHSIVNVGLVFDQPQTIADPHLHLGGGSGRTGGTTLRVAAGELTNDAMATGCPLRLEA